MRESEDRVLDSIVAEIVGMKFVITYLVLECQWLYQLNNDGIQTCVLLLKRLIIK